MHGVALETVRIERVERLIRRFGDRFVERLFAPEERRFCETRRRSAQHYAARLAAKLAARRLLGPPRRLRDIEVVRDALGAPSLRVDPAPAGLRLHVSLSHDAGLAVALVVAEAVDQDGRGEGG